jgi:hypothetical protein
LPNPFAAWLAELGHEETRVIGIAGVDRLSKRCNESTLGASLGNLPSGSHSIRSDRTAVRSHKGGEIAMLRRTMIGVLALCAFASFAVVQAQTGEFGTPEEARALLDKAVASMKADPDNTIAQINKGEGGFKDRDLYVFCYADGKVVAHGNDPTRVGLLTKDLKDTAGKLYGEEMLKVAEEGKVAEVSYMFRRPGSDTAPVPKVALVTKVTDHVCAVGYYKQN